MPQRFSDNEIMECAAKQLGLITTVQAHTLGMSQSTVHRRADIGFWQRVYSGVYSVSPAPITHSQLLRAATLAAGNLAAVSHMSAAWLHRFEQATGTTPEITVAYSRPRVIRNVVVHRTKYLPDEDLVVVRGIPCMSVPRTLIDLSGRRTHSLGRLAKLVDYSLAKKFTVIEEIERCVERLPSGPFRSVARIARLVAERSNDGTESVLEKRVLRWLRAAGFGVVTQHPVRTRTGNYRLDFAFPSSRIAVEVDGYQFHGLREAFDYDRQRDRDLMAHGWRVLRVTSRTTESELLETLHLLIKNSA